MTDTIRNLDDLAAQHILEVIARSRAHTGGEDTPWNFNLRQALAGEFQVEPGAAPVSAGELARQALLVLAEDPETRKAVETMAAAAESSPQKFDFGVTIGLTAAVLFVLQTHVKFERRPDGKWSLQLDKKPTSDALLKGLVQKLISYAK
jgi:hypothetical protein